MAQRLERIDGVPYFGDPVAGPLAIRRLGLAGFDPPHDGFSLSRLLDPAVTPQLTNLSLRADSEALPPFLELMARERALLERIDHVSVHLSDFAGERAQLLRSAELPASLKALSWHSSFNHGSLIRIRDGYDVRTLYDSVDEKSDIRMGDKPTEYTDLVFDWRLRDHISRRVEDVSLLLPLEIDFDAVIDFCAELPGLKKLSLIHPFTESQLENLLKSEPIRRLQSLALLLSVNGGQWEFGPGRSNEYMKANEARYASVIAARHLFDIAFGDRTAGIPTVSIATKSFEVTRSAERIQHCDLRTADAVRAFAECDPPQPLDVLCLDCDVPLDEGAAAALADSGVLGRVFRLNLLGPLDAAAAHALAGCGRLRTVRAFRHWCFHNPPEAIRAVLNSPNLTGVWDLSLSPPDSRKLPEIDALCAESRLLDRAVALGLNGPDASVVCAGGRLGRVRRLDEALTIRVFGDARLATVWLDHPVGRPLRAGLADFVERTYRVEHRLEDLPELERRLATLSPYNDEQFLPALRAVSATAFGGKPVAEGTPFAELAPPQQSALRAIARLDGANWNIGGLMHDAVQSYGLRFWDKQSLDKYIGDGPPES